MALYAVLCLLAIFTKICGHSCGACDADECDACEGLEACGVTFFSIVCVLSGELLYIKKKLVRSDSKTCLVCGLMGSVNITILVYGWPNAFGELQPDNFP